MDNKNIVIIGSSGHAQVVLDIIEREDKYRVVGLIDSSQRLGETLFNYRILGTDENLPALVESYDLCGCFIAIGDNWKRYLIKEKIKTLLPTFEFISTFHPSAQVARDVVIGCGTVLMAGAIVNSDSRIGNFCIINTKASLDHNSIMEDFSSLAPDVTTGGKVRIGAFSAISLGAGIIDKRSIGKHTVIGAGAIVLDDIPDYCVAYGVPAKVIQEKGGKVTIISEIMGGTPIDGLVRLVGRKVVQNGERQQRVAKLWVSGTTFEHSVTKINQARKEIPYYDVNKPKL